jgi:hypothetical protein
VQIAHTLFDRIVVNAVVAATLLAVKPALPDVIKSGWESVNRA